MCVQVFHELEINWERNFYNYPKQNDGFNCGMFIIHYMEEILQGNISKIGDLDPELKRDQLKTSIVADSLDVSGVFYTYYL